ncbi:hypothetical protein, partial [Dietzia alimentaria]|uniref:hypothetical protein n=1 Tax=Dietzia alimentaria TaxID=665550 RepID=UPI00029AB2EC
PWRRRWPDLLTDRRETGADLRDFRGDVCETRIEVGENSVQVGLLGIHLRIISHTGLDVHGLIAARDPRAGVATRPQAGENGISAFKCSSIEGVVR